MGVPHIGAPASGGESVHGTTSYTRPYVVVKRKTQNLWRVCSKVHKFETFRDMPRQRKRNLGYLGGSGFAGESQMLPFHFLVARVGCWLETRVHLASGGNIETSFTKWNSRIL